MAKGFTAKQTIDAPPEAVWAAMTDFQSAPQWMPGIEAVIPTDDTPLAAGKTFRISLTTKGRGKERMMTLATWESPRRFALSSQEGGVSALYTYDVEPQGSGTQVTLNGTCTASGWFLRLLHPLIVRMMARHDSKQLALLKQAIEKPA